MIARNISFALTLMLTAGVAAAASPPRGGGDAHPGLVTNAGALHRWQAMRFGMFIHWGPVTLRGTEIGWSRGTQVPIGEYDNLYREFNPALFSATDWVETVRLAGMKYLVIVAKHHDGFCLWDSKHTSYKITRTPFGRDVLRELADECRRQGIMFCTYYSILDWHHEDYTTRYGGDPRPLETSNMDKYRAYLKDQVGELIRDYHANLLWFDGQWEKSWTHRDGMDLYAYARGLNDSLLINNRVDKGRGTSWEKNDTAVFAGDFGTPEQEVGAFDDVHPWESCMTICTQWAWKPNDTLKSLKTCIGLLARTAGGGGNLLLNVSPMLDGRMEQRQIDRLREMGIWLGRFGESICDTRGGPWKPGPHIASTCRGSDVYVHLLDSPGRELRLPAIPGRKLVSARVLNGGPLTARTEEGRFVVQLPERLPDPNDAVIALKLDGSAETVAPLEIPAGGGN